MPKNTQMHMQWITVNGQSVPLVLPQYWDGEKWVISSEQNPLPVKAELTGSIVEIRNFLGVTITPGSMFTRTVDIGYDFKSLRAMGRSGTYHDWRVAIYYLVNSNEATINPYVTDIKNIFEAKNNDRGQGEIDVYSYKIDFRIYNNSTEEQNYDVYLRGVK